jgi:hypothetical protein
LRPGGIVILTTPQMWHLHEEPFDFFRYTKYGLATLCAGAGLEVVETAAHGGPFAMIGIMLVVHAGSYARLAARHLAALVSSRDADATAPPVRSDAYDGWFALFRLPILLLNVAFGLLDTIPHPGIYAIGNLVVARRPPCPE